MKIPLRIHPAFWLMALFIAWQMASNLMLTVMYVAIIFFSLLAHELGHAFVAKACGQKVAIEFQFLWGQTIYQGKKLKPWQNFLITLCGPLANFILVVFMGWCIPYIPAQYPLLLSSASFAFYANSLWFIFNLLPVIPLDGGKLMNIALQKILGRSGLKVALLISMAFALVGGVFLFLHNNWLVGSVFLLFTYENYSYYKSSSAIDERDGSSSSQKILKEALDLYGIGDYKRSLELLGYLRDNHSRGRIYNIASEKMAIIFYYQNQLSESLSILDEINKSLTSEGLKIFHLLLYHFEKYHEAIRVGNELFRDNNNYDIALINARAHAKIGNLKEAAHWLKSAKRNGLCDIENILQEEDFAAVREFS